MSDDLSDRASLGVSAVVLSIATLISIYQIFMFIKYFRYPSAQRFCLIIFAMPILMGWTAWLNLVVSHQTKVLEFLINAYKSVAICCFIYYIDRLIGWIEGPTNEYSYQRVEDVFLSMKKADCWCSCLPSFSLATYADVKKFRWTTRVLIFQFPAVLMILGTIGLVLYFGFNWGEDFGNDYMRSFWFWLMVAEIVSSTIAMNLLINYAVFANRIPELAGLQILNKFILMKVAMVLTEFQPLIISFFAKHEMIADTQEYSVEFITAYTNSLLLCSEMIIVGFLQYLIFPVDDYKNSPNFRKTLFGPHPLKAGLVDNH